MIFDRKVRLLSLAEAEPGRWEWVAERSLWAHPERQSKTNLFSKVGLGAVSVLFSMHPTAITLRHAIEWEDRHYFLTAVDRVSPILQEVTAAEVQACDCTVRSPLRGVDENKRPLKGYEDHVLSFPAALTEKYMGYKQLEPHVELEQTFVLVTPKAIALGVKDVVEVPGGQYAVQICHTLDPYKNEYEMYRRRDA